jgi:hypothetical protein
LQFALATNQMGSTFSGAFGYKLMDGQGRVLGGITVGDADLIQKIYLFPDLQDLLYLRLMRGYCLKV